MAQVGDAYAYGGNGPGAYDCSGLTQQSFAAAGVELPRRSADQAAVGTPVDRAALQPGDLVFYYSPVSHVAIYIGNGQVVHALNSDTGVITGSVDMPATSSPAASPETRPRWMSIQRGRGVPTPRRVNERPPDPKGSGGRGRGGGAGPRGRRRPSAGRPGRVVAHMPCTAGPGGVAAEARKTWSIGWE